jgi:hypothetical protein
MSASTKPIAVSWSPTCPVRLMPQALPGTVRRSPWAGPIYGLIVWLGFEWGIAPALGLSQAKHLRPVDRLALAGDHMLYGLVLSEMRLTERG